MIKTKKEKIMHRFDKVEDREIPSLKKLRILRFMSANGNVYINLSIHRLIMFLGIQQFSLFRNKNSVPTGKIQTSKK